MYRAHLRYVLTGEIAPWVDKLITYISDPDSNDDPAPHSKSYRAGGIEMPKQELVQKQPKKENTMYQKTNIINTPYTTK